ncbi:MAG: dipeptidase [Woeseiaceae bacterium]|nr:dipeptidase [Woeseiaceae bacterium]
MTARSIPGLLVLTLLLTGCDRGAGDGQPSAREVAHDIAQSRIIVDTHIDVPYRLERSPADVTVATDDGDFDYPRAVAGGLNVAFMSIYTPAELEEQGGSFALAEELIDVVEQIVATAPQKFAIATSVDDVRRHFEAGLISLPLGMENGSPIDGELGNVRHFYDRGIRYITLAHSKSNHLSDSSYDDVRRWGGLSEFGVQVVREMNRLGIMVDVSHLSDAAFEDVLEVSTAPVIASHSSARHFTPGFERNMSDDMIRALAGNGGVIMINYGSAFITETANEYSMSRWEAEDAWRADKPELSDDEVSEQHNAIWEAEHGPYPFADVSDVLDHIDHVVRLVGVDYVGIGSDYDGVGDSLPTGLKDVASYPTLIEGLLARGYSDADIAKILGENLLRVWRAVEAASSQAATTSSST